MHGIDFYFIDFISLISFNLHYRGLELAFQRVPGVTDTSVGYTQGDVEKPTYGEVCSGSTGHTEAIQVGGQSRPGARMEGEARELTK